MAWPSPSTARWWWNSYTPPSMAAPAPAPSPFANPNFVQQPNSFMQYGAQQRYSAPAKQPAAGPSQPPPGWYDPALDAQLRASGRGLLDVRQDTGTALSRAGADYGIALNQLGTTTDWTRQDLGTDFQRSSQDLDTGYSRSREDLQTDFSRGTQDLGRERGYAQEDYDRTIQALQRRYGILAGKQAEGARVRGVLSPGLAAKAAAIRAENQALERQPVDTALSRFMAGNTLAGERMTEDFGRTGGRLSEDYGRTRSRLGEDYSTNLGRVNTQYDWQAGGLGLNYSRTTADLGTALTRAEREAGEFGLDVDEMRRFQAMQAGWIP